MNIIYQVYRKEGGGPKRVLGSFGTNAEAIYQLRNTLAYMREHVPDGRFIYHEYTRGTELVHFEIVLRTGDHTMTEVRYGIDMWAETEGLSESLLKFSAEDDERLIEKLKNSDRLDLEPVRQEA